MQHLDLPSSPAIGGAFRCTVAMRWGDQDTQNHINNALYFRYQEEARVQLFRRAGISLPSTRVGILAHASCDFLKPLVYPGTVAIIQVLKRVGNSSMAVDTIMEREDEPGVAYAKGSYVIVGADSVTGKSTPWTPAELSLFGKIFVV
ncbi:acyl-CoA thioesterase [Alcaligenaceae bacterium]|nr:acyl-CoA thioesterase [Alcaligenaceae bacterium]